MATHSPIILPAGVKLKSTLGPLPSPYTAPVARPGANVPSRPSLALAAIFSFLRRL